MEKRKGEKFGWLGGWAGGFIWVLILSAVNFIEARALQAVLGLLICAAAAGLIYFLAPWRNKHTKYRSLMLPIYLLFFLAVVWAVWSLGDPGRMGINSWWSALLLLPILLPFWTIGDRTWSGGDQQ